MRETAGWTPTWDGANRRLSFAHVATPGKIEARLLEADVPRTAQALTAQPALVAQLGLAQITGVSSTRSTPTGWDGVLDGTTPANARADVYVAVHHHGPRSLVRWAPIGDATAATQIARAEAAKVCGTLAPPAAAAMAWPMPTMRAPSSPSRATAATTTTAARTPCTGGDACFTEGAAAIKRGDNAHAYGAFRRGCDAGHGLSCSGLGDLYNSGKVIRVSFERAAALYRKACGLSNAHGCNNLGWALERGLGIDQDIAGAEAQYVRACTLMPGSPACENADIMKARREGRER